MPFEIKKTKKKVGARYKSLYISESLLERVQKIADEMIPVLTMWLSA